jgi:hypothetical protein
VDRKIEILEAADDRDEPMEYVEAEKMALNHVIATMVEEEKFRILGLMEESLLKHDQEHDDRLVQSKVQEKKQQELMERQACMIITRAARIWVARLILLKKCEDMFEKIFDENFRAFYYRNKITVCICHHSTIVILNIYNKYPSIDTRVTQVG